MIDSGQEAEQFFRTVNTDLVDEQSPEVSEESGQSVGVCVGVEKVNVAGPQEKAVLDRVIVQLVKVLAKGKSLVHSDRELFDSYVVLYHEPELSVDQPALQ